MTGDEDRVLLAGEYVLGLLAPADTRAFEQRRRQDAALDTAVVQWEAALMDLAGLPNPIVPDPELWHRIQSDPRREVREANRPPVPVARRARARPGRSLWSSLVFWRATGMAGALAALALAVLTWRSEAPAPAAPVAIGLLVAADASPGWIVEAFADASIQVLPLVDTPVPPDRALEFWTLRDPAEGPQSLGLIPPGGVPRLENGPLLPPVTGQLFEITLEPATGSPIGRPTGPILFKGRVSPAPAGRSSN